MAGRSGKGVEEFAEKLDTWYDKSQKDEKARHEATIQVFTDFKNIAESNVRDLNNQNPSAGQGQLSHHKKQEIQRAAHLGVFKAGSSIFGQSLGQSFGQSSRTALSASSAKELREWQAELATWELVNAVFDLHHPAPGTDPEAMKREGLSRLGNDDDCTKNEVWERFIISDDLAREKKVVIKWLQQTAKNSENNVDLILEQWAKESGKDINKWKSGWLETKQTIKQAKRAQGVEGPLDPSVTIHGRDAEKPLVTRLDPDAQTRQKGALEKRDVYYEHALWMVAYEMLRRGESMNTINEWFKDRNEGYRAFMLGASGSSRSEGSPNMATPDFGYMHRRSCFLAAKSTSYPYEGAALGIVSGNYEPIQAISSSWDDHLYSYYNALLIARFDSFLLSTPKDRPRAQTHKAFNFPGITEHINNDWPNATKRVVELLKQNKSTSEQAKTPIKLIQSALLTRTLDELVHKVGVAMADFVRSNTSRPTFIVDPDHSEEEARAAGPDGLFSCKGQRSVVVEDYYQAFLHDPHALRILVHLFIVLGDPQDPLSSSRRSMLYARGNVVAAYVEYLQFAQRLQLIPLYASQMETERASMTLARVLPHIPERAEQELCVTNMRIYNIDVEDTLVRYFEFAMGQTGLVTGLNYEVKEPISRYLGMLEKPNADDPYEHLWPKCGRVKLRDNVTIAPEDKAVTHCLMWFDILEERDEDQFFARLVRAYATFLGKFQHLFSGSAFRLSVCF